MIEHVAIEILGDMDRDAQRRRVARDQRDLEHGWAWGRTPVLAAPRRWWVFGWRRPWHRSRLVTTAAVATAPQ
jgi:hypothetical protein